MDDRPTFSETFELGLEIERTQERFYNQLAIIFSKRPRIKQFWQNLAIDEAIHQDVLTRILQALDESKLDVPVDPLLYRTGQKLLNISPEERIRSIQTLNDAYELAYELELNEVNKVFEFLVQKCSRTMAIREFAMKEIQNHLGKLIEFPGEYGDIEWRKSVRTEG